MTDTNTAQMVADLRSTDSAIQAQGWIAPGLGRPNSALGFLNADVNPLSGLAAAGLSWFTPLVSFLGDGLTQLQGGNGASVSSGSQDFGGAGQDMAGLAGSYKDAVASQTSGWTGAAADSYRESAAQHADGVLGLGQGSTTTASAIIGAGQVVAQCIAEVTELIAEAVSQIVPIMTQAVARAGETNGESIAEAIPPCVAIAVEYALRIAAKLAALLASGDNLMKLVQGGMAVVNMIQQAMSTISNQSVQPSLDQASGGQDEQGGDSSNATEAAQGANDMAGWDSAKPSSNAASGGGGGGFPSAGLSTPDIPVSQDVAPVDTTTHSSSYVPPVSSFHNTMPGAMSHTSAPGGAVPLRTGGGVPFAAAADLGGSSGARTGATPSGRSGATSAADRETAAKKSSGATQGGTPMGGMGGARPTGDADKEHHRKYELVGEQLDDDIVVAPAVITGVDD